RGSNGFGRRPSLLEQENSYSENLPLSRVQSQVDGLVSGFVRQATDWRALAAMTAGEMAYRAGKIGLMGLESGNFVRIASVGFGLGAEVSTFELTHRVLHSENSNLWRWSGPGGIRQGLLHSFLTFGTLKGAGHWARGENLFVQHLLQDAAMVLGQQAAGALGLHPAPSGPLAEQFLIAELTNLQMRAGLALAQGFAPRLQGMERILENLNLKRERLEAPFRGRE